jgi:soluble lytic murein transglycosylase
MTTLRCWEPGTLARWCSRALPPVAIAAAIVVSLAQQGPAPPPAAAGLANARKSIAEGRTADAAALLAKTRLPAIADYVSFTLAQALVAQRRFPEAATAALATAAYTPRSPLRSEAVIIAAGAQLDGGAPREAALLLEKELAALREPDASFLLARALEASGDTLAAARRYQRVYYEHPTAPEAGEAADALARLHPALGADFPAASPADRLARARRLIDAGRTTRAITELQEIAGSTTGADRDLALVRVGVARYAARLDAAAFDHLKRVATSGGEAEAERQYYLLASARRLDRGEAVRQALDALAADHPKSPWRLEALISAANQHLVEDRTAEFEPLYRACYEDFAADSRAPWCHWKSIWVAWREKRLERGAMLRDHLRRFPGSDFAATAMYFLGRLAESERDPASARAWYERVAARYALYYYGGLARERLRDPAVVRAQPAEAVQAFLASIAFPPSRAPATFAPDAATKRRLERARLLREASLEDWADAELRFAARDDALPQVVGLTLAEAFLARGEHRRALFALRQAGLDYLTWPIEAAPRAFWRAAFPLPFRDTIVKYSAEHGLDPFLVAGLIRQESAFDPRALSSARAMGLMQIRPLTGRELSRKVGLRGFTTSMLYRPDVSVRLGTYHLRGVLAEFGKIEVALAAYNAGRSRALKWRPWIDHSEPAEFIETIPFVETHGYVQAVLRNAAIYRRLW